MFGLSIPCTIGSAANLFKSSERILVKILAVALAVLLLGFSFWMANRVMRLPIDLSDQVKKRFTDDLKSAPEKPDFIILSCPTVDENACAFAEQFIPMFQRAGWKVEGPQVNRVTLGRYSKEVVVADYGPPLVDPQNPDQGVWTQMLPWRMREDAALQRLGVPPATSVNDPMLPKTETRLYFGMVPTRTLAGIVRGWIFASGALP
jgi:hypothetical protein